MNTIYTKQFEKRFFKAVTLTFKNVIRPSNSRSPWHCSVCGEQFRSIEGILETDKVVTCSKCHKKVCRKKCSTQDLNLWICQICQQPESWFKGILKVLNPNQSQLIGNKPISNMDVGVIDEVDEDLDVIKKKEKDQVREFIERLVETMLGGGLDNVSVTRLYNDPKYDTIMTRYHSDLSNTLTDLGSALHMSIANLPIVGQSPCSAHAGLKLLIQRIIQEAIGLSSMKKVSDRHDNETEINDRTYEDLLATAIINKVVENYQEEIPSSSANSISSKLSFSSTPNNKEYFFGEETLDSKWKKSNNSAGDLDTASVSSIEEWVRSDSSNGSTKYVDHNSYTIKQGTKNASSSDEEEVVHIKHKKSNWKENWTLQKRHLTGSSTSTPVPMLVPNPISEAKVLIGDREADDTSDLSDIGSDYEDTGKAIGIESLLVDSKTIIGGKNPIASINNEIQSDGSTDASNLAEEKDLIFEQLRISPEEVSQSVHTKVTSLLENAELSSFDSHVEQDSEYTEKYATLPRTIVKDFTSCRVASFQRCESHSFKFQQYRVLFLLRTYSVREKQKWENAVEMKNNPYTEENINKRLTKSSFTDVSSLFGRDYYIKQAARAAGARKLKEENGDETATPKMQQPESDFNEFLYQAVPVVVDAEDSPCTESDSPILASPIPSSLLEISSDSDLSIERVYNLNSGKVYETVGGVHKEIVKRSVSPEGIAFKPTTEFDKTFTITDENHNSTTTLEKKRSFLRSLTETEDMVDADHIIEDEISPETTIRRDNTFSDSIIENVNNTTYEISSEENSHVQAHEATEDAVIEDKIIMENNNDKYSIQEFSLEFSTDGENRASTESSIIISSDPEIVDLKDKHLVKDKLGLFSKSYPNLAGVPLKKTVLKKEHSFKEYTSPSKESIQQSSEILDTSVYDLRRKFNKTESKDDGTKKQLHSLTARSISQAIRKELQEVDTTDGAIHTVIAEEDMIVEEKGPNYFPDAKSRIKFFENLNR
ncbi:hypothetical protein RN001_007511 [Aquatica leii]|uniref:FYVE-type domain-containing protein n=1 Tax=Aquatica leii TaxID=1421715 RepID=A0AAN7Q4D6_9COLE|nr:hypothetical protein RN001_007511 [Aquatica leii]